MTDGSHRSLSLLCTCFTLLLREVYPDIIYHQIVQFFLFCKLAQATNPNEATLSVEAVGSLEPECSTERLHQCALRLLLGWVPLHLLSQQVTR